MIIGQPHIIKEYNAQIIKGLIAEQGPITKPLLSTATGLSLPTVNKIVDVLESSGVIREHISNQGRIAVGRPAKEYVLNENAGSVAVLFYLNGEFIASLRDFSGTEIERRVFRADIASCESALASLRSAIELFSAKKDGLKAVGVGLPGVVKADGALRAIPMIPTLEGCRVSCELSEMCGLPVFVENDVKLMTVGYYADKLERRYSDIVLIYAGSGIGSGVIINKRLHKGSSCFAGECSSMVLGATDDAQGNRAGLEKRLAQLAEGFDESGFEGPQREEYCELLARVAINFVCALNPQAIAFRGVWVDDAVAADISRRMRAYIPHDAMPEIIQIDSDECGLTGAYRLCMNNLTVKMKLVQQQGV